MNKNLFPKKQFRLSFIEEVKGMFRAKALECIQVGITSFCQGRCIYCPRALQEQSWQSHHMTSETFAQLWELMKTSQRVHLQGWGEPLLHPHFFEFVELARRADCQVSTTSCGLYLTETMAEKIVESGIDLMAFSLAGTDNETNASRKNVPFTKVAENIQLLQRIRKEKNAVHLEIHLAYLVLASHMEALKKLPEIMDLWDVHGVVISTLDCDAGLENYQEESFQPHDTQKITQLRTILEEIAPKIRAKNKSIHFELPNPVPSKTCRERAHKTCYVDTFGTLSPCIYLNLPIKEDCASITQKHYELGNINKETPLSLWNKEEYLTFRQNLVAQNPPVFCATCPKRFEA